MSSLQETENASAAVAVSPDTRVKLADIEADIAHEAIFGAGEAMHGIDSDYPAPLDVLTICVLTMRNGFTVIGKSAPADAANFNRDLGRKFAREDAIRQCWPLMGYALRERLMRSKA